jgi:hypothetical protein
MIATATLQRWTRRLRTVNRALVVFFGVVLAYDLYLFGTWLTR